MGRLTHFDGNCYVGLSSKQECVQELGRLEDLKEKGRLVELPCNVGEECYIVKTLENEHSIEIEKTVLKNTCLLTENENGQQLMTVGSVCATEIEAYRNKRLKEQG